MKEGKLIIKDIKKKQKKNSNLSSNTELYLKKIGFESMNCEIEIDGDDLNAIFVYINCMYNVDSLPGLEAL